MVCVIQVSTVLREHLLLLLLMVLLARYVLLEVTVLWDQSILKIALQEHIIHQLKRVNLQIAYYVYPENIVLAVLHYLHQD